jgi:23S rRNA pseudouridine2605 synthase
MRINRFVALATGLSRRVADSAIAQKRVYINGEAARAGQDANQSAVVTLDGKKLFLPDTAATIIFNKPAGYVVSRDGQGSRTIYDLLPAEFKNLKAVGRLDKDSSGILLLTNDGTLANELTHPSFQKEKVYEVEIDKNLSPADQIKIEQGVQLEDGLSLLALSGSGKSWTVKMHEGKNRQIRRTFEALGYKVTKLHRTQFGAYKLTALESGSFRKV